MDYKTPLRALLLLVALPLAIITIAYFLTHCASEILSVGDMTLYVNIAYTYFTVLIFLMALSPEYIRSIFDNESIEIRINPDAELVSEHKQIYVHLMIRNKSRYFSKDKCIVLLKPTGRIPDIYGSKVKTYVPLNWAYEKIKGSQEDVNLHRTSKMCDLGHFDIEKKSFLITTRQGLKKNYLTLENGGELKMEVYAEWTNGESKIYVMSIKLCDEKLRIEMTDNSDVSIDFASIM
jgi:hypothetical protein